MNRLIVVLMVLTVSGCTSLPIYNVEAHPIPPTGRKLTLQSIKQAIVRAGVSRGWQFKAVKRGHLLATFFKRRHTAVVDVHYTQQEYRILYKASQNLNAQGGNIHRNYNRWIRNLESDIQVQLVIAGGAPR